MPIDTAVQGDPESIRETSTWLADSLSPAVDTAVTDVFKARDDAESDWQGDAATLFRSRMDTGGRDAFKLAQTIDKFAEALKVLADDLATAQRRMTRIRDDAREGGLDIDGKIILEPGSGPALPAEPYGAITDQEAQAYTDELKTYNAHQDLLLLYVEKEEAVDVVRQSIALLNETFQNAWGDVVGKWFILAASFGNDAAVGLLAGQYVSNLKNKATLARELSQSAEYWATKVPDGSGYALSLRAKAMNEALEFQKLQKTIQAGERITAKLPVVGWGLTGFDVWYDVTQKEKPVGKAVIGGAAGVGGAIAGGAAAGAVLGSVVPGAGTAVGAVVGAGGGLVGGLAASAVSDTVYDHLPEGTRNAIEEGFKATGGWVKDTADSVGSDITDAPREISEEFQNAREFIRRLG
ncbi:WXG100 family type VII secretion target [Kineosporia babensis]|uniref:Uncharacterized protein n=1 Tax=Kineosporia babensis TaxID=499548 RepID=A0A9X1SVM0_9ACTN|nr:hypothetical protein [Kineosporia babensis]MCD5313000.1 hypothetical protein [Kineosporia babensis]